jgi:hypothetical protein
MPRTSTTRKKVQPITETITIGDATIQVNLPRIPAVGPCKIWGKSEAAVIRKNLKETEVFLNGEHYRRLGEALGDSDARDLQTERQFAEEYAVLHDAVLETMEGRLREIVVLGCGRAMLEHFPKSPLGLLHFGNHGLQIGLFRRPNAGEKALTVELPVGTLARWEWTTLLSPVPGGNDLIGSLRPIADAAREKLRREDEKMAERRLETLKGQTATFVSTMKCGKGRTACHIPALRTAPECWLDLGLNNNQIRVVWVGGGNAFQQSLTGLVIPQAAIETGHFTFNVRNLLGGRLRCAEYLLASLLDALELGGIARLRPNKPAAGTASRPATQKPMASKTTPAKPATATAQTTESATVATISTVAPVAAKPAPAKPKPNPDNVARRERRKNRRARLAAKADAGNTPDLLTFAQRLVAARKALDAQPPANGSTAAEVASPAAPELPMPATAEPAPSEISENTTATASN